MSFIETGYKTRRFNEITEAVRADLENRTGTPIQSDPSTIIGILNNVYSGQVSTVENNLQAMSSNLDILTAEGVYLDKLVRYIGVTRLPAISSRGFLKIWRNSESPITSSRLFSDSSGLLYKADRVSTLLSECNEFLLEPVTIVTGTTVSLTINDAVISKTAIASDTNITMVDYLASEITALLGFTAVNESNKLRVSIPDIEQNDLKVDNTTGLNIVEVAAFNYVSSVEQKELTTPIDSITEVVSFDSSILRVSNPLEFVDGRDLETDNELRVRQSVSVAQGGNTTVDAIKSALLQLPNVTDVFIRENTTLANPDSNGLPAKSYECIVVNGSPVNISQEIWNTKPAGVETHGSITTSNVLDDYGSFQTVKWSRPEEIYIFVEVSYSLYDEESFPSNGEALIKEAVLEYGRSLSLDNDIIPSRFIGVVHSEISGVDNITIRIGQTTDVNDVTPNGGYVTSRIPISEIQLPVFTSSKVSVIAL